MTWDATAYDRLADPQEQWAREILARAEIQPGERVLDAGCGSGRVTKLLLERTDDVVAVDADINQHLGMALGMADGALPRPMGSHLAEIKEYLRGDNPRISSASAMVKTTPPGRGSRLLRLDEPDDPIHTGFATVTPEGPRLMVTGPFSEDDLGVACYHSKVGAAEMYLNHLVDGPGEYVVVDMTAGADSFASGMFTRFDMTFLVAEPTVRGVGVYRQYAEYARDHEVAIRVIGNINVALIFGLLQFVTTFGLAWLYSRFSTAKLDPLARQLNEEYDATAAGSDGRRH